MKLRNFLCLIISFMCVVSLHGAEHSPHVSPDKNWSLHQECSICNGKETGRTEFSFLLPCGHIVHDKCCILWIIQEGKVCPQCRKPFVDRGVSISYPFDQNELVAICLTNLMDGYNGIIDSVLRLKILDASGLSHLLHLIAFHPDYCSSRCKYASKLIEAGADVNNRRKISGGTALHEAAIRGKQDLVEVLLKEGADQTITCYDDGGTALDYARSREYWDIVRILLNNGSTYKMGSSYYWMVRENSFAILQALIKAKVPMDQEDFADLWKEHCKIKESARDGRIGSFIRQHLDK
jgi:hypothetical protein